MSGFLDFDLIRRDSLYRGLVISTCLMGITPLISYAQDLFLGGNEFTAFDGGGKSITAGKAGPSSREVSPSPKSEQQGANKGAVAKGGESSKLETASKSSPMRMRYGPVKPGENLLAIARTHAQSGVAISQLTVAIYHHNPHAFTDGDINRLKPGVSLEIPSREAALATSSEIAALEMRHLSRSESPDTARSSSDQQAVPPSAKEKKANSSSTKRTPDPPSTVPLDQHKEQKEVGVASVNPQASSTFQGSPPESNPVQVVESLEPKMAETSPVSLLSADPVAAPVSPVVSNPVSPVVSNELEEALLLARQEVEAQRLEAQGLRDRLTELEQEFSHTKTTLDAGNTKLAEQGVRLEQPQPVAWREPSEQQKPVNQEDQSKLPESVQQRKPSEKREPNDGGFHWILWLIAIGIPVLILAIVWYEAAKRLKSPTDDETMDDPLALDMPPEIDTDQAGDDLGQFPDGLIESQRSSLGVSTDQAAAFVVNPFKSGESGSSYPNVGAENAGADTQSPTVVINPGQDAYSDRVVALPSHDTGAEIVALGDDMDDMDDLMDMARAYVQTGQLPRAQAMLVKIIAHGSPYHRQCAQELLDAQDTRRAAEPRVD